MGGVCRGLLELRKTEFSLNMHVGTKYAHLNVNGTFMRSRIKRFHDDVKDISQDFDNRFSYIWYWCKPSFRNAARMQ